MELFNFEDVQKDVLESMQFDNSRSRCYCGILYPFEDVTQHFAFTALMQGKYKCVFLLHDKDTNEDGTLKKQHLHFIIRFTNARERNSLAKELKIKPCYIQPCSSFNAYSIYMLHLDEPFKHQYDITEVGGTLYNDFLKAVQNVDNEQIKVKKILKFLEDLPLHSSRSYILKWICDNSLYDTYRRGYSIFRDILNQKDGYL